MGDGHRRCAPPAAADGSVVAIWRAVPLGASGGRGGEKKPPIHPRTVTGGTPLLSRPGARATGRGVLPTLRVKGEPTPRAATSCRPTSIVGVGSWPSRVAATATQRFRVDSPAALPAPPPLTVRYDGGCQPQRRHPGGRQADLAPQRRSRDSFAHQSVACELWADDPRVQRSNRDWSMAPPTFHLHGVGAGPHSCRVLPPPSLNVGHLRYDSPWFKRPPPLTVVRSWQTAEGTTVACFERACARRQCQDSLRLSQRRNQSTTHRSARGGTAHVRVPRLDPACPRRRRRVAHVSPTRRRRRVNVPPQRRTEQRVLP